MDRLKIIVLCVIIEAMIFSFMLGIVVEKIFPNYFSFEILIIFIIIAGVVSVILIFKTLKKIED